MDKTLYSRFIKIPEHERYGINPLGEVYDFKKQKVRHQYITNGYPSVHLDGSHHYIHRLVAEAFVPNPEPVSRRKVSHRDRNKKNNLFTNLVWATNDEVQTRSFKK